MKVVCLKRSNKFNIFQRSTTKQLIPTVITQKGLRTLSQIQILVKTLFVIFEIKINRAYLTSKLWPRKFWELNSADPQLTSRGLKSLLKISKFWTLVVIGFTCYSSSIESQVNFCTVCVPMRSIRLFISEIACLTMKSLSRFVLSVSGTNRALDLTFDASTEVALSVYSRKWA